MAKQVFYLEITNKYSSIPWKMYNKSHHQLLPPGLKKILGETLQRPNIDAYRCIIRFYLENLLARVFVTLSGQARQAAHVRYCVQPSTC